MKTSLHVPLLVFATVLSAVYSKTCPSHLCTCDFDKSIYTCSLNNRTVNLVLDVGKGSLLATLSITCKGNNASCDEFPHFRFQAHSVDVTSCPSSVLRCVHNFLDRPLIEEVTLYNMTDPLVSEDVEEFNYADKLIMELAGETPIPIAGINSWSSLKKLEVTGGILDVSSDSFNHSSLSVIVFDRVNLSSVPVGHFDGLTNLIQLEIRDSTIEEIRVGFFKGLGNLQVLSLENSPLKYFDVEALADIPKMQWFSLSGVLLQSLPNDFLNHLPRVVKAQLGCSSAMSETEFKLGLQVYSHHPTLKYVILESCKINELPENLFNNPNIEGMRITDNVLNHVPPNIFANLTKLNSLQFSNNSLHDLPDGIFDELISLKFLSLADNHLKKLAATVFKYTTFLESLSLENNELDELPDGIFANLKFLTSLDISNNGLLNVQHRLFQDLDSLERLYLENNRIAQINYLGAIRSLSYIDLSGNRLRKLTIFIFDGANNLTEINLGNNQIAVIESGSENGVDYSPFKSLIKLETLDLSGNQIRELFKSWSLHLQRTRLLNLSNNIFQDFKIFQVEYSKLNITIDLQYNDISNIVLDPRVSDSDNTSTTPSQLLLDNNPIHCDCNTYGLYLRLKGAKLHHDPQYILNNSTCNTPPTLEGKLLKELSPAQLICDLYEHRPNNCSSFIVRADTNEIILKCIRIPQSMPDLNPENVPYTLYEQPTVNLYLDEQPKSIDHLNITKLYISNAGINSINFKPTQSLKVLDLSHNNLVTIPDEFVNTNISIYLTGNPLRCDCQTVTKFKKSKSLADADTVFCVDEGKNFTGIDESELCNRTHALTAFIGTTAVCGLFLTMIAVAMCKYVVKNWTSIKKSLFKRLPKRANPSEVVHEEKRYDLFISFVDEDEEFIRENFMQKLEHELGQKVCVPFRDWAVGDPIPELIIHSVSNSRKTVVVLTEEYVASEMSHLTFSTAHELEIQEGKQKVIIVIIDEDILKNGRLSNDLESYRNVNPYLLWGDPDFWQAFEDAVSKKD